MLMTTRHIGESIRIGEGIVQHILEGAIPGYVRIGIEAPREVRIVRAELADPPKGAPPCRSE